MFLVVSPGCWTDINRVSPSGDSQVPVSLAATGAEAKRMALPRFGPIVGIIYKPLLPNSAYAPAFSELEEISVQTHKFANWSNIRLSGHEKPLCEPPVAKISYLKEVLSWL